MHEPTYLATTSRARDRRTLDLSGLLAAAFRASARSQPEQLDLLRSRLPTPAAMGKCGRRTLALGASARDECS